MLLIAVSMVLALLVGLASTASADPGYMYLTNPVFYSIIDDQGGAWDTVTWYQKEMIDLPNSLGFYNFLLRRITSLTG